VRKKLLALQALFIACVFCSEVFAENPFEKLTVDIEPILQNGCVRVPATKEGQGACCYEVDAHLDCTQVNFEKKYGCYEVQEVPNYFGGLKPSVPIVECIFEGNWQGETKDGIQYKGAGMLPIYNKYILFDSSGFKILNNPSEFKKFFVPIESPEEALSFAAALTGSYPLYRIEIPKGYKREASIISSTYVETPSNQTSGYKVHLFDYKKGGCGPHYFYSIDYVVTAEGDLTEIERQNIWRDPKQDNLCID
jgi:hypothetical protein